MLAFEVSNIFKYRFNNYQLNNEGNNPVMLIYFLLTSLN